MLFIDLLNITRFKTTLQGEGKIELSTKVLFTLHDIFMVISFLFSPKRKTYIVYFLNSTLEKWIESISNFQ